jgi:hypothetical protein
MRLVLLGAAVAGLVVLGCQVGDEEPAPAWAPGAVIPVEEIAALYKKNEAAADRELRGRPVRVAVTPTTVTWGAHPTLPLPHKGPPTAHATAGLWQIPITPSGDPLTFGDVQFRFPDHATLGGLQPERPAPVLIEGVCRGVERYNQGTWADLRFLAFDNCRVVVGP